MAARRKHSTDWHLDKKVTVTLILALLANAGASVWWAARMDAAVQDSQKRIEKLETSTTFMGTQQAAVFERLARIDEGIKYQSETLKEVKAALERGPKH
jgi:hypothetical protein